jgi:hypothetical protein
MALFSNRVVFSPRRGGVLGVVFASAKHWYMYMLRTGRWVDLLDGKFVRNYFLYTLITPTTTTHTRIHTAHSVCHFFSKMHRRRSVRKQARHVRRPSARRPTQRKSMRRKSATSRSRRGSALYALKRSPFATQRHASHVNHKTKGGVGGFETICFKTGAIFYNGNAGMVRVDEGQTPQREPFHKRVEYVKSLVSNTPKFFTCDEDLAQWYARSTAKTALIPVAETFVLTLKLKKNCELIDIYSEKNHNTIRDILKGDTTTTDLSVQDDTTLGKFNKSIAGITAERGGYRLSVYEDDYEISEALRAHFVKNGVPVDGFCCEKPNHMEYMFCTPTACFESVTDTNVRTISTWQAGELIQPKNLNAAGPCIVQGGGCTVIESNVFDNGNNLAYNCMFPNSLTIKDGVLKTEASTAILGEDDIANYTAGATPTDPPVLFASPTSCTSLAVQQGVGAVPLTS